MRQLRSDLVSWLPMLFLAALPALAASPEPVPQVPKSRPGAEQNVHWLRLSPSESFSGAASDVDCGSLGTFRFGLDSAALLAGMDPGKVEAKSLEPTSTDQTFFLAEICRWIEHFESQETGLPALMPVLGAELTKAGSASACGGLSTLQCQIDSALDRLATLAGDDWPSIFQKNPLPPSDPCLPCSAVDDGTTVIVDPGGGGRAPDDYVLTGAFFYQDSEMHTFPFSYDSATLSALTGGDLTSLSLSPFYPTHSATRPGYMVFSGQNQLPCSGNSCIETVVRRIDFYGCRNYDSNVQGCNAAPECSFYHCSNQCLPTGTSNCDAGCDAYCPCRKYNNNIGGCNADPNCSYYSCSNECHPTGTSQCFADCRKSDQLCDCRAFDLDVDSCNKAVGCSYYHCSGQCHATGTSNCAAGCC